MKTKQELNYRKQDDAVNRRHTNCDNCQNLWRLSPYMNRCALMDTDTKNRKVSIQLDGVCDSFNGFR